MKIKANDTRVNLFIRISESQPGTPKRHTIFVLFAKKYAFFILYEIKKEFQASMNTYYLHKTMRIVRTGAYNFESKGILFCL